MYKKTWLIPIIVLLLCSSLLISYQKNSNLTAYATDLPNAPLPHTHTVSDMIKLEVNWSDRTITALREGTRWHLSEPSATAADSSYIYDIIHSFLTPGNLMFIESDITDPSAYGITDYSPRILLEDSTNIKYTFVKGDLASKDRYYVYIPATKSIYTVPLDTFDNISYDLSIWYDRNYIQFDATTVSAITIQGNNVLHTISVVSTPDGPSFTSTTLTPDQVTQTIQFLTTSRAHAYVATSASPQVIESYGFNQDTLDFTLHLDNMVHTFKISTISNESGYQYVLLPSSNAILSIPAFGK